MQFNYKSLLGYDFGINHNTGSNSNRRPPPTTGLLGYRALGKRKG
ncbi:Protein of unknown function [Pyronema omphalodes CBS 100304]|uniref:Uncharacterized protein n=1 Tax=Pyronema omphalodes (strain CBS 100304) TaxID=1076935 RepID=U4KZU3_PYROM|nr:Protein of unknown function [Pyronema omphalodes CBS 100304]